MTARRTIGHVLIILVLLPGLVLAGLTAGAGGASAQKVRSDFWGMHDNDWGSAPTVPVGSANFTTSGTYWSQVETMPGVYDWARLDSQVAGAEAIRAQPMVILGQTPRFHSSAPTSNDYADHMPNVDAWRGYVASVAERYGSRLDYQIWPEPNIIENWKGSPGQMAKLTAVASKAITANAGKKAKVVSPAVALRLPSQQKWTVNYFKQKVGGKRVHTFVDVIAIDPFPEQKGTPEDSYKIMRSIKSKLGRIGVRKPFWNNEINYGVAGGGDSTGTHYSVDKQQSYVIRTFVLSAAAKMQRTYWLAWFKSPELAVHMTDENGVPQQPADSYEVVRSWLNGTDFKGCRKKKNDLWVCTTRDSRTEVRRIYWKPSGDATIRTPASTKRVEDQEGGVNSTGGSRRISVDYRPIMVASRK